MDVFDYADKLLERFSDKLPDKLEINENSFACVHNLLTENLYFPNYEGHNLVSSGKSNELAESYRMKGNEMFRNRKFFSALCLYNESLCYAAPDSESLGVAFANRSAVYAEIDEFELCVQNIQWARASNYPKSKIEKLQNRENECSKFSKIKPAKKKLIQLSYKKSTEYPFVIDALKIENNNDFGRHIVTKRKLKAGDVIVIEEPFVAMLTSKSSFMRCTNCLGQFSLNLLPCPTCTSAMFCSTSCMDEANKKFHKLECDFSGNAFDVFFSISIKSALRTFLSSVYIFEGSIEKLKNYLEQCGNEKASREKDLESSHRKNLLKAVNNLTTNESRRHAVDKFRKMSACAILIDFLQKHSKFDEILQNNSNAKFLGNFMYKHIQIAETNYHELYALSGRRCQNEQFGVASFPFSSLLSHSCCPNVIRLTFDARNYIIVSRNIEVGEQIFDNYGFHHNLQNYEIRQQGLLNRYQFTCKCEACLGNFPVFENLPEIDDRFDQFIADDVEKLENFSVHEAKQAIKKFSRYITQHARSNPCYEISLLQECMLRCFRAFEKDFVNINKKLIED